MKTAVPYENLLKYTSRCNHTQFYLDSFQYVEKQEKRHSVTNIKNYSNHQNLFQNLDEASTVADVK